MESRSLSDLSVEAPAILIVGKTGAGKSALANTLFGRTSQNPLFHVSDNADSDTQICQSSLIEINNVKYHLVDTPGAFDTRQTTQQEKDTLNLFDSVQSNDEKIIEELSRGFLHCIYGIKAVLLLLEAGRFTKEQQSVIYGMVKFLGEDSLKYMIVVFTKCNKQQTENMDYMESTLNLAQMAFLNKIGNRWIVFPNPDIYNLQDPVTIVHMNDLKKKILKIPGVYSTEIFKRIREAREKELERNQDAGMDEAKKAVKEAEGGCFSIQSKVLLENGNVIELAKVHVGDRVCCGVENGKLIFSEILVVVHTDEFALTEFLKVECTRPDGSEATLRLTPGHHIFTHAKKTDFAYNLIANETKIYFINDGDMFQVVPHHISKDWQYGYIAPITRSGSIVVDNILCSCYATVPPYQGLLHLFITPLHLYSLIFPSEKPTREIHPYFRLLKRGQWIIKGIDYFSSYLKYMNK